MLTKFGDIEFQLVNMYGEVVLRSIEDDVFHPLHPLLYVYGNVKRP